MVAHALFSQFLARWDVYPDVGLIKSMDMGMDLIK